MYTGKDNLDAPIVEQLKISETPAAAIIEHTILFGGDIEQIEASKWRRSTK